MELAHLLGGPFQCSDKCAFRFCSFHAPPLCASFRRRRLRIWRWQADGAAPEKGDAADHADRDGGIAQAISTGTCISCSVWDVSSVPAFMWSLWINRVMKLRAKFGQSVQGTFELSASWQMPGATLWRFKEPFHRGWAAFTTSMHTALEFLRFKTFYSL